MTDPHALFIHFDIMLMRRARTADQYAPSNTETHACQIGKLGVCAVPASLGTERLVGGTSGPCSPKLNTITAAFLSQPVICHETIPLNDHRFSTSSVIVGAPVAYCIAQTRASPAPSIVLGVTIFQSPSSSLGSSTNVHPSSSCSSPLSSFICLFGTNLGCTTE